MFFEFLNALLNLDLNWLAGLFFSNLHYLFFFVMICFYYWGPSLKKVVVAAFLLVLVAWTWVDFELLSGWVLFVGGFLSIYYITKIMVVAFAEDMPQLKDHLVLVNELQFLALFLAYNLFMA